MTVYETLLSETEFTIDHLRIIERRMIAAAKLEGAAAPSEAEYKKKVLRVKEKMAVCQLQFETVIEIFWPRFLADGGFTQKPTGPGFYLTQRDYYGGYNT